jgi:glycosyltransferase involved in cell wall biosynthesis
MKIIFFCRDTFNNIELFEYYKQDVDIMRELGHDVLIINRFKDIPFKFDLIFVWWWTYAFYPVFLGKILGKPVIITGTFNFKFPEEFKGNDFFSRSFLQRILIKYSVKNATKNLFVNKHEFISCTNYFNLKSSDYFPHVISNDYLKMNLVKKKIELLNISWSGKKNLIRKGIPDLIEALHILKNEGLEIKLTLAGKKGDGIEYLYDLIKKFNLNSSVQILGEITKDEKIYLMSTIAIFVQPSHYEGFGLAMAEAMACGACVITCNVGAVKDVVSDCGLYAKPGSAIDLAKKIKIAIEDEDLRNTLQKKAFIRANAEFSYKKKRVNFYKILSEF